MFRWKTLIILIVLVLTFVNQDWTRKLNFYVKAIPLKKTELLSTEQCNLVYEKIEISTLSYLFDKNREICKSRDNSDISWQKKLLKAAQPPYLEFHNEIYPSKMNLEMEYLAEKNRSAMLSSMGTGDDHSKCFILGFSGYGNRGMWSAAVAKGLASQFFDNNVPLRWDIVAGISSGGFNALISSHFVPGGNLIETSLQNKSRLFNSTNLAQKFFNNTFIFDDMSSRDDSVCSNGDKDIKFEFWLNFGKKDKKNVKCYSNSNNININEIYLSGDLKKIENELSFTNYLYEIYMRANPNVVNDDCTVPTSQDSTKWWSTILHTFTNFGKKPISSFCTMRGWKKFYRDSMLKLMSKKREALVSASRLFDGTLIHWSLQYIISQIYNRNISKQKNSNSNASEGNTEWIEISEDDASKLADIATASNAVSGVYMPIGVNNEYFVWGGLRGEANLEAAIERCKEIKPGINEEDIVIDFITGSYYREEIFLSGSYVELLGKEHYFGKIFRKIKNYFHKTNEYARPDPPQLFELFNRAWEFITASSRGMFPIKALKRKYPKVKLRFIIRPKTLRFFPKSSYYFPGYKEKILIMTDGYYMGYNAIIIDSDSIETKNSV
ncbi:secreted alpha beta hydrolase family protein [Cryptosporidium ubiquitum]|uniref:Secreted alpha beta hydrolase family protein n=1 Tax=Cryptosporidium ubiquitum TaxID=857276 RepID=A0A1J4MK41_9CRYT|nr:secreted alpha beta hydrolase family protein [Cryptosporidium ubiquitum]OII73819.1 secreted alpha beta hydrolase family protein [Cryptosporidium ubiquitum]